MTEIPATKPCSWLLEFVDYLEFGACDLKFSIYFTQDYIYKVIYGIF